MGVRGWELAGVGEALVGGAGALVGEGMDAGGAAGWVAVGGGGTTLGTAGAVAVGGIAMVGMRTVVGVGGAASGGSEVAVARLGTTVDAPAGDGGAVAVAP